jgi:predicted nucleotidyltransferase
VDLTDPTRAITPTLDGPVLAALAVAGRPLTVGEVTAQAVRGSEIGIRKCLGRLVDQGIVKAVEMGRNRVHELNRDHIAASVALALAELKPQLVRRLRDQIATWPVVPNDAWLFGSAARGDGDANSDVDLLFIRRPRPGEQPPQLSQMTKQAGAALALERLSDSRSKRNGVNSALAFSVRDESTWEKQIDQIRGRVNAWTGNQAQIVELSTYEIWQLRQTGSDLFDNVHREGIRLMRPRSYSAALSAADAQNT